MTQTADGQCGLHFSLKSVQPKKNLRLVGHFRAAWCDFGEFHGFGAARCENEELYQITTIGAAVAPQLPKNPRDGKRKYHASKGLSRERKVKKHLP